ncbi:MAG: hypothetical protein EOO37_00100 [Cytophagaceae bacterium]|nr:MAG: hypothetical protein EOO37_00100 [Cytophagaceae bacterium]
MARLQSPKSTLASAWHEYGGWVIIIFTFYVLWTFRKVFSSIGDTAGDTVAAAAANVQASAAVKTQRAKVQAASGTKTVYTEAQLAVFRADATTLAGYFGTLVGGGWRMFSDEDDAFGLLKKTYTKYRLINNLPIEWTGPAKANGVRPFKNVTKVTAATVLNPYSYKLLIADYKDVTNGNDLASDIRKYITSVKYTSLFKWIL